MNPWPADSIPDAALRELVLPFARQAIAIRVLKDPMAALAMNGEELPQDIYWGELWPSAVALADALLDDSIPLPSGPAPILEVGCGTGLVATAAAIAGGRVLATDREPRALLLAQENARRNGVAAQVQLMRLDWAQTYEGRHGLILTADCLYRTEAAAEVACFLRRALSSAPGARAVVVDPDRVTARNFSFAAQEAGFNVRIFQRPIPFVAELGPVRELPAKAAQPPLLQPLEATFYELT